MGIWQDLVNGGFELLGAPFILMSIIKLHRDKRVRGISWIHILFFSVWGCWNLYYYPHLSQWASFIGGLFLVGMNTIWLIQIVFYSWKEKVWQKKI